MDDEIKERMLRWADWLLRGKGAALGYPRECPYTRMQARSDGGFCSPEADLESAETEKAVQALPVEYKEAVQAFYVVPGTREQQAGHLGCGVRTMERRVKMAHRLIARWLDEERRVQTGMDRKNVIPSIDAVTGNL